MRTLSLSLIATFALACSSESPFLNDARNLSAGSGEVDSLLARNQSLTDRAAKLPAEKTGDVNARLSANKTDLTGIKGDLTGGPAKIQAADDAGKPEEAKAAFEAQKVAQGKIPAAKAELDAIEEAIAALETAPAPVVMVPTQFTRVLPSGYNVLGNLNGIEAQLLAFIEDTSKQVDKTTWFDFDRLLFKTASDQLEMEKSKEQLTNIAEILKAYPKVTLKVGGYTDNVGKPKDNLKLSTGRAKNVAQNLIEMGIAKNRLDPEGYGANHFVCPANDTDECRAKNRRISVRVTAK